MIKIYILNTACLKKSDFYSLCESLPFGESENSRLSAMENSSHKWESLGGLLALDALVKKVSDTYELNIKRTPTGKPYFENVSHLPFGISHSKEIAAAALGDSECMSIGFDIEVIDESVKAEAIAKRFFSENEIELLKKNQYSPESFYSIWTAKEAFSKLDGLGLASIISMDSNDIPQNAYLSRLSVDIDGRRAIISVYCYAPEQTIQIFFNSEDNK